jgi:hypothetical protein
LKTTISYVQAIRRRKHQRKKLRLVLQHPTQHWWIYLINLPRPFSALQKVDNQWLSTLALVPDHRSWQILANLMLFAQSSLKVDFVTTAERKHFSANFDISTYASMEEGIKAANTLKEKAGEILDGCPILVRNIFT